MGWAGLIGQECRIFNFYEILELDMIHNGQGSGVEK